LEYSAYRIRVIAIAKATVVRFNSSIFSALSQI
jgi:hypothetical protein